MDWIIQNNLHQDTATQTLISILERNRISYHLVKVIPFTNGTIEPEPNVAGNAIVIGSMSLVRYAQRKNLYPGAFTNDKFNYRSYIDNYGQYMLNSDAQFFKVNETHKIPTDKEYFFRPVSDGKAFAGTIDNHTNIRKMCEAYEEYGLPFEDDMEIMYSSVKYTQIEMRFVIMNQKPITASVYKRGNRVVYDPVVDTFAWDFAQKMALLHSPAFCYVMDVAFYNDDYKIIELNCMNSAGWYACDVNKIVERLELEYSLIGMQEMSAPTGEIFHLKPKE